MTAQSAAQVQPTTPTPTAPRGAPHTSLRGVQLIAARLIWLALALAVATIFVAGVPAELALLRQTCSGGNTVCMPAQLTPSGAHAIRSLTLTPAGYATVLVALDIISVSCWSLVALALFLRRSSDRMAIFSALTLITFGAGRFPMAPSALLLAHPQWALAIDGARFLGSACLSIFVFVFPGGHFAPWWTRWIALAWIIPQLGEFFLPGTRFDLTRVPAIPARRIPRLRGRCRIRANLPLPARLHTAPAAPDTLGRLWRQHIARRLLCIGVCATPLRAIRHPVRHSG